MERIDADSALIVRLFDWSLRIFADHPRRSV